MSNQQLGRASVAPEVLGVYYDTFGFIQIDHVQAVEQFRQAGITLHLARIGVSLIL